MRRVVLTLAILLPILVLSSACKQPYTPTTGEVEATEFMGRELTPINEQNNNALRGTQYLDRETYRLSIEGLATTTRLTSAARPLSPESSFKGYPLQLKLVRFTEDFDDSCLIQPGRI